MLYFQQGVGGGGVQSAEGMKSREIFQNPFIKMIVLFIYYLM